MTETPITHERPPAPERQQASPGLMLHIANGEFDPAQTNLDKNPRSISPRSFAALDAQNKHIREQEERKMHDYIKKQLENDPTFNKEAITPEFLRDKHMALWASIESKIVRNIISHSADYAALRNAFGKLDIVLTENPNENANLPDQFHRAFSNKPGVPGNFYQNFCSGQDMNQKLLTALDETDMVNLHSFLVSTLGSQEAYDALLATKQTQNTLGIQHDFSQANPYIDMGERSTLQFFKDGDALAKGNPLTQPHLPAQETEQPSETSVKKEMSLPPFVGFTENQGRRDAMEDAHTIETNLGGDEKKQFYAIYDGHTGRQVADTAAEALHEYLLKALNEGHAPTEAMRIAYQQVQSEIRNEDIPGGATAVTAFIEGNTIVIGNLGDARAVLIHNNGEAERLSRDRKVSDPEEQEVVEARGGIIMEGKVLGGNKLLAVSAALGDNDIPGILKEPDIKELQQSPNDRLLILACDGIWDVIKDEEVASIIGNETYPQKASQLLVNEAYRRGSTDNLSAIVVKLPSSTIDEQLTSTTLTQSTEPNHEQHPQVH